MRNSETKFEDSMLSLTMVAQATDSESFSLDPAGLRRPLKSLTHFPILFITNHPVIVQ
jgi:hypothetical protein